MANTERDNQNQGKQANGSNKERDSLFGGMGPEEAGRKGGQARGNRSDSDNE